MRVFKHKKLAAIALVLCLGVSWSAIADDADVIPPEILRQMDPDILTGKRPVIHKLKQTEIFGLRENPEFKADFVTFDFDPGKTSSVQEEILRNWIKSGANKLYFEDANIVKYSRLLGLQASTHARWDFASNSPVDRKTTLLRHSVNTDCRLVRMAPYSAVPPAYIEAKFFKALKCGQAIIEGLPPSCAVVIDVDNHAAAGRIHVGDGVVYFRHRVSGTDNRRWILNWWHWAMGLSVPGAAETGSLNAPALRLGDLPKHDTIELKNGDSLSGKIQNAAFAIRTSYGVVSVKKAEVDRILLEGSGANVDRITLRIGDRLSGQLQEDELKLILASGSSLIVSVEKVASIRLAAPSTSKK